MTVGRWTLVAANAACTTGVGAVLLPALTVYPRVAAAVVAQSTPSRSWLGQTALDAALCFGPLLLPGLLLFAATALRAAWRREPGAAGRNGAAFAGWLLTGGLVAALCGGALS